MMNTIIFSGKIPLLLAMIAAIAAPSLKAAEAAPASMLKSSIEEVLEIAYPRDEVIGSESVAERVRPILDRTTDFEGITRRVVGPAWREFTSTERVRAVELFAALVVKVYADRFTGKDRPHIEYKPAVLLGRDRWELPTQVTHNGIRSTVIYRIGRQTGELRIYDVTAEGVSFVANYRAQFDAIFQRNGAAGVLRALEDKHPRQFAR